MALKDLIRRLEDFLGVSAAQDAREDAGGGDKASSPRRREALRHGLNLALRATISIGLLAWVISGIDLRAAGAVMLRANLLLVPVIFALVIAERLLASLRWYLLVRGDPRVTYWRITRLLFTTTFAGFFFPGHGRRRAACASTAWGAASPTSRSRSPRCWSSASRR